MVVAIPESAAGYGFRRGPGGTHSSRTIMLRELGTLLQHVEPDADLESYRRAIVIENVLAKNTMATRE